MRKRALGGPAPLSGFTIVETLIFLAVSGFLIMSAFLLIGGQQAKTEFSTTVRNFDSEIQDIANNVATGYYTRQQQNFTCKKDATGNISLSQGSGTDVAEGMNGDCTFIGQLIFFSPPGNRDAIRILSVAGRRIDDAGLEPQSLTDASPLVIAPSTSRPANPDSTQDYSIAGFSILKISINNGATSTPVIGFFTTFSNYTSGQLDSGSTNTDVYALPRGRGGSTGNSSVDSMTAVEIINNALKTNAFVKNPGTIQICLQGGTGQIAVESIQANGNATTAVNIYDNTAQAEAAAGGPICT